MLPWRHFGQPKLLFSLASTIKRTSVLWIFDRESARHELLYLRASSRIAHSLLERGLPVLTAAVGNCSLEESTPRERCSVCATESGRAWLPIRESIKARQSWFWWTSVARFRRASQA